MFVDPAAYADEPRFEAATALLRRDDPVHWVEGEGFNPFWAITKHADVFEIETKHAQFLNEPRPVLGHGRGRSAPARERRPAAHARSTSTAPSTGNLRGVTAEWFLPKSLAKLDAAAGRAGPAVGRPDGRARRPVRLRPRHRHADAAERHPRHPRAARERLPAHAGADPAAVRRGRRGDAAGQRRQKT